MDRLVSFITFLTYIAVCLAEEAITARQSSPGLSGLFQLGSMSSLVSSIAPMLLMVGLGALLLPVLGSALFFREGRTLGFPKITPNFVNKVTDTLEKVLRALEEVDKKY